MNGFKIVLQKPFLNPSKVFKRFRIGFFSTVFKKTCLKPLPGLWGMYEGSCFVMQVQTGLSEDGSNHGWQLEVQAPRPVSREKGEGAVQW